MKFEKKINLVAFEVWYFYKRQPKPRTNLKETVILDGGMISALERLGIRPAGYIAQHFERNGYTVSEVRWGERIQAHVDLAELWDRANLQKQAEKILKICYQPTEKGGMPDEPQAEE